ncbi:hypothetical protein CRM22_006100 [Opisthorchis felineus]|uniref:Uncharacterized protein n=1 Tax=Opisthorchis felineus TaxID=147828 RepID=A0A4S2LVB6_OPIFE|nr:hypothetical protein CRM22_006100 [Opisthorchis felineus]
MSSSSLSHCSDVRVRRATITPQTVANLLHFYLAREKLTAASRVSALLAGFSLVAIIELDTSVGLNAPQILLAVFTTVSCLTIVCLTLSLMISSCIEPHIDCYAGLFSYLPSEEPPHIRFRIIIEVAWVFGTVIGMSLFLAVMLLACWVKFWYNNTISLITSALVIIPAMIMFIVFSAMFNRNLTHHAVEHSKRIIDYLEPRLSLLESGLLTHDTNKEDDEFSEF